MTFTSKFTFNDKVLVELQKGIAIEGEVVGVSFSPSKVFYDVQTEFELLIRVDSALVHSAKILDAVHA